MSNETVKILGVRIDKVNQEEAYNKFLSFIKEGSFKMIFTPNTEIVMMAQDDHELKDLLQQADMVIPDGIGLIYASKINNLGLTERVPGVEMMDKILNYCNNAKKSIYILGGAPGVAEKAVGKISEVYPDVDIRGIQDGYFKEEDELKIIDKINDTKPDVLFVALGAPKQEKWIYKHRKILNTKVAMGVGGSVDIWAGTAKRAPQIFINLHLEWFFRLLMQPSRIGRMMALPKFMLLVLYRKIFK